MKGLRISATACKMLVGMLFLVSAAAKFVTVDVFEVYVYSFGLIPLGLSFYVSRLVIGCELVLGASLISNRNHRFTLIATILFLVAFLVFLAYAHLVGRTDSCNCFGDLLPLNPVSSMLKNAVLLVLTLFAFGYADTRWHPRWWLVIVIYLVVAALFTLLSVRTLRALDLYSLVLIGITMLVGIVASLPFYDKWYVTALLILAPFVTTFILTPPDTWFYHEGAENYDKQLFLDQLRDLPPDEAALAMPDSTALPVVSDTVARLSRLHLGQGRHLVALFSPTCDYCRLAAGKISIIQKRYDIDPSRIEYVFPTVKKAGAYDDFFENTQSERYHETHIDKTLFIKITRGAFPLVLLVDDGDVVATYSYRNIDESAIANFLKK